MTNRLTDKFIEADLCDDCPARRGEVFVARLRGSSFRGRLIEENEEFEVGHCPLIVGKYLVANVQIANIDTAAAEQDVEVLSSSFEEALPQCYGATEEENRFFCTPINTATETFIEINYTWFIQRTGAEGLWSFIPILPERYPLALAK